MSYKLNMIDGFAFVPGALVQARALSVVILMPQPLDYI